MACKERGVRSDPEASGESEEGEERRAFQVPRETPDSLVLQDPSVCRYFRNLLKIDARNKS